MDELRSYLASTTQAAFAAEVGVSQGRISQWLSAGEVSPRKAAKVSQITGIPVVKLCPSLFQGANDERQSIRRVRRINETSKRARQA